MSDSIIQIQNVNKWFGDFQVLKEINLEVKPKEKIVVCGPSGSGKSTLIRCINRYHPNNLAGSDLNHLLALHSLLLLQLIKLNLQLYRL